MDEKLKDGLTKVKDFWNKYDKKQKRLIISIVAIVVVAMAILSWVLSVPSYETLIQCEDSVTAADVADVLTSNEIAYTTENSGLTIKVKEEDMVQATYLIAQEGFTAKGYDIDDYIDDGGFSTTSEDKERLYQKYLEDKMVSVLTSFDFVKNAYVTFSTPKNDLSVLATDADKETFVSVKLTLKNSLPDGAAESMANYCAIAVGNDSTARITIIDSKGNTLFRGNSTSELSDSITTNEKEKIRQLFYEQMVNNVTSLLANTNLFSSVAVSPSLDITFDKVDVVDTEYYNEDGVLYNEYLYEQEGGTYSGGVPGTDSNDDDTTYTIDTGDGTNTSINITKNEYAPSNRITHTEGEQGVLNKATSSLSVVVNQYEVHEEEALKDAGELDDMTWEEYKAANSQTVPMEADFTNIINAISYGTGIAVENIHVSGYVVPMFNDKVIDRTFVDTVLPIIIAVVILLLLAFILLRSLRPVEVVETEPELFVEDMLQATRDRESVEEIEYDEKSEVRKAIEKFVDENPESVALLLRNWLNNDWE